MGSLSRPTRRSVLGDADSARGCRTQQTLWFSPYSSARTCEEGRSKSDYRALLFGATMLLFVCFWSLRWWLESCRTDGQSSLPTREGSRRWLWSFVVFQAVVLPSGSWRSGECVSFVTRALSVGHASVRLAHLAFGVARAWHRLLAALAVCDNVIKITHARTFKTRHVE